MAPTTITIDFVNAQEAADIIGVHASTITAWIQTGELSARKSEGTGKQWLLNRAEVEAKAAVYVRPTPVPSPQSYITLSDKPPAKPGLIGDEVRERARETVIGRWAESMPIEAARRWFSVLLEGGS